MKVSIAIPVYNGARYLERALNSALAQTYGDIEVIVVNDGSTDDGKTEEIGERYARRDRRVAYYHQSNQGVAGALNTAIHNMSGEIFTWLSHDDIFDLNKTERQVRYYRKLGRANAILFSDWRAIDADERVLYEVVNDHKELRRHPRLAVLRGLINGITIFCPKEILVDLGGFDVNLRYTQDYDCWLKALDRYDFVHMPETLISYRVHGEQDSHHPAAHHERDALWVQIVRSLPEMERVQLSGSSYRYFRGLADYLKPTGYEEALQAAALGEGAALARRSLSVCVYADDDWTDWPDSVARALGHGGAAEIIVMDASSKTACNITADPRLQYFRDPLIGRVAAYGRMAELATSDYIAFASGRSDWNQDLLVQQMLLMQRSGATACFSPVALKDPDRNRTDPPPLEAFVIHKIELLQGLQFIGPHDFGVTSALWTVGLIEFAPVGREGRT